MVQVILDNDQSMLLAVKGYTHVDGKQMFKKSRHDNVFDAQQSIQQGDVLAQNSIAVFILNPSRNV